ncbi:HAMP domain-containing sensor histidine kinase [Polyangium sp. 15x6]|uniref:sensor histidine kinase n=1 Tax=Polyangium sp. 15x6 TaxID=3042687 RepID=UPI00249CEBBB|nr:HAMP domain-containing sensor histidine kinase [Polyangium sp. 15x6]MDI3291222.1 HAMP domain-containing sensor histidine kinase [Polyangium sp. 15x6]
MADLVRAHVDLEERYKKLEMFSHSAAHTLKTDWQGVSLLVDELSALMEESRDGGELPVEDIMALLAELGPRAAKGVQTVRDLLVYAMATGKPHLEPLSLRDVVQGVVARVGSPTIRVADDVPHDEIRLDGNTFPVALLQLVENAVKYGEGRPVEISYANGKLRVQDHGRGIPLESLQQIFVVFKRIAKDVSGTGLGLAIAKQIIDAHGYHVWAESEGQGKGSAFVIDFGQIDGPAIAGKAGGA